MQDLLIRWGTVAGGIIGRTVKGVTAFPGTERVGICCEWVAPFCAKLILNKDDVNERFLADR